MQLIGYLDSPYVRRAAVSARFLGIEYEHREISIFREYEHFLSINPLVKVPTLVLDDGSVLVDSTLIIDYFEMLAGRSLIPAEPGARTECLRITGVALVAMEKVVSLIIETEQRPAEFVHGPWIERLERQLANAVRQLEADVGDGASWLLGDTPTQADVSTAVAWSFIQLKTPQRVDGADCPGLQAFTARAEALPEFVACPIE